MRIFGSLAWDESEPAIENLGQAFSRQRKRLGTIYLSCDRLSVLGIEIYRLL